jgi:hypothetical protein
MGHLSDTRVFTIEDKIHCTALKLDEGGGGVIARKNSLSGKIFSSGKTSSHPSSRDTEVSALTIRLTIRVIFDLAVTFCTVLFDLFLK